MPEADSCLELVEIVVAGDEADESTQLQSCQLVYIF